MSKRFNYTDDSFGPRVRDMKTGRWMGVDLVKEMASVIPNELWCQPLATLSHPATQAGALQTVPPLRHAAPDCIAPQYKSAWIDGWNSCRTAALAATQPNAAPGDGQGAQAAVNAIAALAPVMLKDFPYAGRYRCQQCRFEWGGDLGTEGHAMNCAYVIATSVPHILAAPGAAIAARERCAKCSSPDDCKRLGCADVALREEAPATPQAEPVEYLRAVGDGTHELVGKHERDAFPVYATPPAVVPAVPSDAVKALNELETLLVKLMPEDSYGQPSVAHACAELRAALSQTMPAAGEQAGAVACQWDYDAAVEALMRLPPKSSIFHEFLEQIATDPTSGPVYRLTAQGRGALDELQTAYFSKLSMTDEMRSFIEGMSVSVDVSTGEDDAGHRYFGTITEVMDDNTDRHGVTLLVQDAKPNFTAALAAPGAAIAAREQEKKS